MLSEKRDKAAAKAFFDKSIGANGLPEKVTIDKSGSNKAAAIPGEIEKPLKIGPLGHLEKKFPHNF